MKLFIKLKIIFLNSFIIQILIQPILIIKAESKNVNLSEKNACLFPGAPNNGRIWPIQKIYNSGEKLRCSCDDGFKIMGLPFRVCLGNNRWSNSLQYCRQSVSFKRPAFIVNQTHQLDGEAAVDGDPLTCVQIQYRWMVVLENILTIESIYLKAVAPIVQLDFMIFINVQEKANSTNIWSCSDFYGTGLKNVEGEFRCGNRTFLPSGSIVEISSLYPGLKICDVNIFVSKDLNGYDEYSANNIVPVELLMPLTAKKTDLDDNDISKTQNISSEVGYINLALLIAITLLSISNIVMFGLFLRYRQYKTGKNYVKKNSQIYPGNKLSQICQKVLKDKRNEDSEKPMLKMEIYDEVGISNVDFMTSFGKRKEFPDILETDAYGYLVAKN